MLSGASRREQAQAPPAAQPTASVRTRTRTHWRRYQAGRDGAEARSRPSAALVRKLKGGRPPGRWHVISCRSE